MTHNNPLVPACPDYPLVYSIVDPVAAYDFVAQRASPLREGTNHVFVSYDFVAQRASPLREGTNHVFGLEACFKEKAQNDGSRFCKKFDPTPAVTYSAYP